MLFTFVQCTNFACTDSEGGVTCKSDYNNFVSLCTCVRLSVLLLLQVCGAVLLPLERDLLHVMPSSSLQ